jgi:hypothetical protein
MDNGLAALKAAGLFDKPAPVNTESNRPESNARLTAWTGARTSVSTCASAERRLHPSGQHAHAHQRPRLRQCVALNAGGRERPAARPAAAAARCGRSRPIRKTCPELRSRNPHRH